MSENAAITAKAELKKAIKAGKTECATLATIINRIIDGALWEYLNLPGESAADKLHNLICLPYDRGGLNSQIQEVEALLTISSSTLRKFRVTPYPTKQGHRRDLEADSKSQSKTKTKKPSTSQLASDRAAERAAQAIPEINTLLERGLIAKNVAAKVGQKLENPDCPTDKDKKVINKRQQVSEQLKQIIPEVLPEGSQELNSLRKKIKQTVENISGLKSSTRISFNTDPHVTAKTIVKAIEDQEYLKQLTSFLELEIEKLEPLVIVKSNSKVRSQCKQSSDLAIA